MRQVKRAATQGRPIDGAEKGMLTHLYDKDGTRTHVYVNKAQKSNDH